MYMNRLLSEGEDLVIGKKSPIKLKGPSSIMSPQEIIYETDEFVQTNSADKEVQVTS